MPRPTPDYTGFHAVPCPRNMALKIFRDMIAISMTAFDITHEVISTMTLPSLRVFAANEAYVCGVPRTIRKSIGNWISEKTADVYVRDHRRVMHMVWNLIGQKHDTAGCTEGRPTPYNLRTSALDLPSPADEAKKRSREVDEETRKRETMTLKYLKRTEADPKETGHDKPSAKDHPKKAI